MHPEINKDIPIGELIINHPAAFEVLLKRGFHCIGCGLAAYETLEQGAKVHGMDDAAIEGLVAELKEAVEDEKKRMKKMRMDVDNMVSKAAPGIISATGKIKAPDGKIAHAQKQKSGKSLAGKKSFADTKK